MAPLTWRNVEAPNFSGVASSLGVASQLLNNATSGLSDAIDKRRATVRQGDSSAAMLEALKYTDANTLGEGLRNGQFDGRNLSDAAIQFLGSRQRDLLGNDTVRLNNAGQGINNATGQFNLDQGKITADQQASYLANRPAANQRMADIRTMFESGDPVQAQKAQKLMAESSPLFSSAGMSNETVMGLISGNRESANAGMDYNRNVVANNDFYKERFRTEGEKGLVNSLISGPNRALDAQDALTRIRNIPDMDAKTLGSLTKDITDNAAVYFPAPTALDTLSVKTMTPDQVLRQGATQTGGPRRNLPSTFAGALDRTEGGGDYDTLFGHAQRKQGSPFAGAAVSKMTVGEAIDFSRNSGYGEYVKGELAKSGQNPRIATPMGRHQIVGSTLAGAAKEMGLDPNTVFDADTQDAVAMHIAKKAVSGASTMDGKINAIKGQWEGFKNLPRAELENIVREVEGSTPLSPSELMRNSVLNAGGQRTGSAFSQQPVQVAPPSPTTIMDNAVNPSTNQPVQVNGAVATTAVAPVAPTPQEQVEALPKKTLPGGGTAFVDTNGQLFQAGQNGAFAQVDATGMPIGGAAYQPEAIKAAPPPVSTPTNNTTAQAAAALTPAQLMQQAQIVNNQGIIDSLSNTGDALEQQLVARPYRGQDPATVTRALKAGPLANVPETAITEAINQISKRANVPADVAAILAQNATEGRDLSYSTAANVIGLGIPNAFFAGDRFGGATEGRTGTRIDVDKAISLADNFRTLGNNEPGSVRPGVNALNTRQGQEQAQQQVQALATGIQQLQGRAQAIAVAVQQGRASPEMVEQYKAIMPQLQMMQAQLVALQGKIAPYTGNQLPQ